MSVAHRTLTYRVLTPMAAGALAVVRLAGHGAREVVKEIFHPHGKRSIADWPANVLRFGRLYDGEEPIDEAIVTVQPTDEPAVGEQVDICVHGGVRVVQRLGLCLQRLGGQLGDPDRPAWPVRDAIDAEALQLLPQASTRRATIWLAAQRRVLADRIAELIHWCAEDTQLPALQAALQELLGDWPIHRRLVYGTRVCLWGPANAGKSSLANCLRGQAGSIVAEDEGTTRDWVAQRTAIDGVPITLIDVAGAGHRPGELQAEALRRAGEQAEQSEILVVVLDVSRPWTPGNAAAWTGRPADKLTVVVANKSDLPSRWQQIPGAEDQPVTPTCALQPEGVEALQKRLAGLLRTHRIRSDRAGLFSSRQAEAVRRACEAAADRQPQAAAKCLRALLHPAGDPESGPETLDRSELRI